VFWPLLGHHQDKGNSIVILPIQQYESKVQGYYIIFNNPVQNFICEKSFQTAPTDPTNALHAQIRKTVKESKTLIPWDSKWRYINMNPLHQRTNKITQIGTAY
jgi:hypothetical protein